MLARHTPFVHRVIQFMPAALLGLVMAASPARADPILSVDFDSGASVVTQPGFTSVSQAEATAAGGKTVNGVNVKVAFAPSTVAAAGSLGNRLRTTPTDNPPSFTMSAVYRDFLFADASGAETATGEPNSGIDITLSGLTPNQGYQVDLWAFDSGSPGSGGSLPADPATPRVANWTGNGAALFTTSFDGNVLPTSDADDHYYAQATADAGGTLLLSGRRVSGNRGNGSYGPGVFVNGFTLTPTAAAPEPAAASVLACASFLVLGTRRRHR